MLLRKFTVLYVFSEKYLYICGPVQFKLILFKGQIFLKQRLEGLIPPVLCHRLNSSAYSFREYLV